jgi:hypothetical protein
MLISKSWTTSPLNVIPGSLLINFSLSVIEQYLIVPLAEHTREG